MKTATAAPAAGNLRLQQQREEYNEQRPHEALQMKTPGEFYRPSHRAYPSRLEEPQYGNGREIRRVRDCGRIRWWGEAIFVGKALAGEVVGLEPIDDGIWMLRFFHYPIGRFDERTRKIEKLPSPTAATPGIGAHDGAHEAAGAPAIAPAVPCC